MSNIILAMPYLSDDATLSGTEEVYGSLVNLQRMQPTDVWAASGGAPSLIIDLRANKTFNIIALLRTNATGADQWRVRMADTEANLTANPSYDTNYQVISWVGSQGDVYLWNSDGWTNRWIRIDLITIGNPFTVGRLYVANAFQPAVNYKYGAQRGYYDHSAIDLTAGGNLIPNHGVNRKIINFALNLVSESDVHMISEINRLRGGSRDVLVITDPDKDTYKADNIYYGIFQARRASVITAFNKHEAVYQMRTL